MIIFVIILLNNIHADCSPWGVRLLFGQYYMNETQKTQLYIVFNTNDNCNQSKVQVNNQQIIQCQHKNNKINLTNFQYNIHICSVTNLIMSQDLIQLTYIVYGKDKNNENEKKFTTFITSKNTTEQLKFLVFGDWGLIKENQYRYYDIFGCLNKAIQQNEKNNKYYSAIMFMGDMAYDLETNNSTYYNQFLKKIQPYTSKYPFMVTPGNHQYGDQRNISQKLFIDSFIMPYNNIYNNNFYYFILGHVSFINFNPYQAVYNLKDYQIITHNKAVQVKKAFQQIKIQRKQIKIIPFSHYPCYCSYNLYTSGCLHNHQKLIEFIQLFNNNSVKLYLSGHVHLYQRSYPIQNNKKAKYQKIYQYYLNTTIINPDYPIYIVQGMAGTDHYETLQQCNLDQQDDLLDYTAKNDYNCGFGILEIGKNQLIYQHRSSQFQCMVTDKLTIKNDEKKYYPLLIVIISIIIIVVLIGIIFALNVYRSRIIKPNKQKNIIQYNQLKE